MNIQPNPFDGLAISPMPTRRIELIEFVIDTNRINAKGMLPNMKQIEKWHQNGVIILVISDVAFTEVGKGRGGSQRRDKASYLIMSGTMNLRAEDEFKLLGEIENILFPVGAKDQNEKNDTRIVFNAHKYGDILITEDRNMLRNRKALLELGVFDIKTDAEVVDYIRDLIRFRDEQARHVAKLNRVDLPPWVGQD